MKVMSFLIKSLIIALLIIFVGCSGSDTVPGSGDIPSIDEQADDAARSPLFIKVDTQFSSDTGEGQGLVTTRGYCYIDPDDLATNNVSCTVKIPEGDLHYSNTKLTVGSSLASMCPRVVFRPYVRRIGDATDTTFTPPGADADVDCTDPEESKCWAGAALDINEDFPKHWGWWFPTQAIASNVYTVKSAWEKDDRMGNTHVANNLTLRTADVVENGITYYDYEAATGVEFYDYQVFCQDSYERTLFSITMIIADDDTPTLDPDVVNDEWYDWAP